MNRKNFKKIVLDKLDNVLFSRGFKKNGNVFYKEMNLNIFSWMWLNTVIKMKGEYIAVNPVVGVRSQELEKFVCELRNKKNQKFTPATISKHIGYLTPENTYLPLKFTIDDSENIDFIIDKFSKDFDNYAITFFDNYSNLPDICNALEAKKFYIPIQSEYKLAAAYYLLTDFEKAKIFLTDVLEKISHKKVSQQIESFKNFASKMLELIEGKL